MKKKQIAILVIAVSALTAAAGGGVAWWLLRAKTAPAQAETRRHVDYKYITLDKVIVMLRAGPGEPLSHYMAVDLVFKAPLETEKLIKQHLPLLRSIAVKALSVYTFDKATQMTVEDVAADINRAYTESYESEGGDKPFAEALIGKIIIE